MKTQAWLKLLAVFFSTAIAIAVMMYILGYILLKMPLQYVAVLAAVSMIAAAIGLFGPIIAALIKRRKH